MKPRDVIRARWTGEAIQPMGRNSLSDDLERGEVIAVTVERVRSAQSHRHYFAMIGEGWANLPEQDAGQPWALNPETLRQHALIAEGYADVEVMDAGSEDAAIVLAAALRKQTRRLKGYCVCTIQGTSVALYTAQSQSYKAMGRRRFQQSKDDVLSWISARLETAA